MVGRLDMLLLGGLDKDSLWIELYIGWMVDWIRMLSGLYIGWWADLNMFQFFSCQLQASPSKLPRHQIGSDFPKKIFLEIIFPFP